MFRVVSIQNIGYDEFNEESFLVEEAFFFTIKTSSYYIVYNHEEEIIGIIPHDYNLFFKVDGHQSLEDVDIPNLIRLFNMGEHFYIVGTKNNSQKACLIPSSSIKEFKFVEGDNINIPFTNKAFDSDGIVVFKNMGSLAESISSESAR